MKWLLIGLCLLAFGTLAQSAAKTQATANGKADGAIPAWSISTASPDGWTADCCTYAEAIGVNFVIYKGAWTGKPERVMVLNVWPRKLPTLAADWKADRKHYLEHDPHAKVAILALPSTPVPCHGLRYQGTDHIDDLVVFCDPGKPSDIRFSWSMTLAADDPQGKQLAALFRQVVAHSRYRVNPSAPH